MTIRYVRGDATDPPADGSLRIITHVCNDIGAWGSGFVMSLSHKWRAPEAAYRNWLRTVEGDYLPLGEVQLVWVHSELLVANMIAQQGIRSRITSPRIPLRYGHLTDCLYWVAETAQVHVNKTGQEVTIHMPRIGCGLAGGNWQTVEAIINLTLPHFKVTVYDRD